MTDRQIIAIEGQEYDSVTGLPISNQSRAPHSTKNEQTAPPFKHSNAATYLHHSVQHSTTLHRRAVKRPSRVIKHSSNAIRFSDVTPHPQARKFAPHPVGALAPKKQINDIGPVPHPHVVKAHAKSAAKQYVQQQSVAPTASQIKEGAISAAVAKTQKQIKHRAPMSQRILPRQRITAILSATFALVLLGGYFTYLNMPQLSVRVAAAQAGINADYPDYHPDGYSLNGPVTYGEGRVSMNFKSNSGSQSYIVSQSKSSWNSEAVLDNYVTPRAGSSYIPYAERGLTIYTFGDNATWVNGGILYTIQGDAPLSSEQIRKIATSLL